MKITRKSVVSGLEHSKEIPVNPEDYVMWSMGLGNIEDLMPYLNDEDKEFILSGIVKGEWEKAFHDISI